MQTTQDISFDSALISPRFAADCPQLFHLNELSARERLLVLQKIESNFYLRTPRRCRMCDGPDFSVLAEQDRYGFPVQTSVCHGCGLVQTNPDFRPEDYIDFYTHHYRRLYIADLVGEPKDLFQEELWRGQKIYRFVRKHALFTSSPFVLEVGCGAGGILQAFRERGFDVLGTDYGAENLAYGKSRGMDIRQGDLFSLNLERRLDLIIYSHVLEHVYDPNRELAKVRELLAPDGYLYIEVPGIRATRTNVFQGDFMQMFHLAHIYNFTLATLTRLLADNGFQLVAGNEEVRSLFRKGEATGRQSGECAEVIAYMRGTEKHRSFYRAVFRVRSRMRSVAERARAVTVSFLKAMGVYSWVRRLLS